MDYSQPDWFELEGDHFCLNNDLNQLYELQKTGFNSQKYPVCHLLMFPVRIIFMASTGAKNTARAYTEMDNTYDCNRWRCYNILNATYK